MLFNVHKKVKKVEGRLIKIKKPSNIIGYILSYIVS